MSLLETLIGFSIAAILAVMLVPNWQSILERGKDDSARLDITRFLQRAWHEANITKQTVIVCKSQNQLTCGGDWQNGMIMYKDTYKNGELQDASQIIARYGSLKAHHQLYARFYPYYHDAIHFNPMLSEQTDNGSIWFCHQNASHPQWLIHVNKLGINSITSNIPESYRCH